MLFGLGVGVIVGVGIFQLSASCGTGPGQPPSVPSLAVVFIGQEGHAKVIPTKVAATITALLLQLIVSPLVVIFSVVRYALLML